MRGKKDQVYSSYNLTTHNFFIFTSAPSKDTVHILHGKVDAINFTINSGKVDQHVIRLNTDTKMHLKDNLIFVIADTARPSPSAILQLIRVANNSTCILQ